jgi:hypothetical protein
LAAIGGDWRRLAAIGGDWRRRMVSQGGEGQFLGRAAVLRLGASTSGFYNSNIAGWVHELAPMPCW